MLTFIVGTTKQTCIIMGKVLEFKAKCSEFKTFLDLCQDGENLIQLLEISASLCMKWKCLSLP